MSLTGSPTGIGSVPSEVRTPLLCKHADVLRVAKEANYVGSEHHFSPVNLFPSFPDQFNRMRPSASPLQYPSNHTALPTLSIALSLTHFFHVGATNQFRRQVDFV